MKQISRIKLSEIDVSFDFTTDCKYWEGFWTRRSGMGGGKTDPDSKSIKLRQYHQALWSKPLPNGDFFDLDFGGTSAYLRYKDIRLSSDSITTGFRYKRYRSRIDEVTQYVPDYKLWMETIIRKTYSIGGMIIFPSHANSINGMRGMNHRICDRWDLTLECIKRYYDGVIDIKNNPLGWVLEKDKCFFDLFESFKGYVDFFFLQDCVAADYSFVKMWIPTNPFADDNYLPKSVDDYLRWIDNILLFVKNRNKRIEDYISGN